MKQPCNKASQAPSDCVSCAAAPCTNNPLCKPQFLIRNKTYYGKLATSLQSNQVHAKVQHMSCTPGKYIWNPISYAVSASALHILFLALPVNSSPNKKRINPKQFCFALLRKIAPPPLHPSSVYTEPAAALNGSNKWSELMCLWQITRSNNSSIIIGWLSWCNVG